MQESCCSLECERASARFPWVFFHFLPSVGDAHTHSHAPSAFLRSACVRWPRPRERASTNALIYITQSSVNASLRKSVHGNAVTATAKQQPQSDTSRSHRSEKLRRPSVDWKSFSSFEAEINQFGKVSGALHQPFNRGNEFRIKFRNSLAAHRAAAAMCIKSRWPLRVKYSLIESNSSACSVGRWQIDTAPAAMAAEPIPLRCCANCWSRVWQLIARKMMMRRSHLNTRLRAISAALGAAPIEHARYSKMSSRKPMWSRLECGSVPSFAANSKKTQNKPALTSLAVSDGTSERFAFPAEHRLSQSK